VYFYALDAGYISCFLIFIFHLSILITARIFTTNFIDSECKSVIFGEKILILPISGARMKANIRSFLCISLLLIHLSMETAYKAAKFTAQAAATGISLSTLGLAADLLRNYTLYPNPQLAQAATLKDLDTIQQAAIKLHSMKNRQKILEKA